MTRPAHPPHKTDRTSSLANVMAHPLFPVIAAVWFAALFGMGALAASSDALASLVVHLHVPAILAAAAPPLGATAHILIAIGLAGLGAGFGLALGLVLHARAAGVALFDLTRLKTGINARVIRASAAKPGPKIQDTTEDFANDGALTPTPRVRNRDAHPDAPPRRPLVVTEDVLPYHPPVTVIKPAREPVGTGDPASAAPSWTDQDNASDFGVDLGHVHDDAPFGAFLTTHPATVLAQDAELPPFFTGSFGDASSPAESGAHGAEESRVLPPETGPLVERAHVQSVPLDAPVFHPGPMPLASRASVAPQVPIADVPVASLGLVQLIERLAQAISVRQARHAAQGYRAVAAPGAAGESADPLLRTKPSRLGRVGGTPDADFGERALHDHTPVSDSAPGPMGAPTRPEQLHDPLARVGESHDDWADGRDDDLPPRFLGGPAEHDRAFSAPFDATVFEVAERAPEDAFAEDALIAPQSIFGAPKDAVEPVEARYSSLVTMPMVRPDLATRAPDGMAPDAAHQNDPVVQFPYPAGDNPAPAPMRAPTDHADRALRDALATLRRMSAQR